MAAASIFRERLQALAEEDEVSAGGNLSVWLSEELIAEVTALASEIGITRSALARELLAIALPLAWQEVRPDLAQRQLLPRDPDVEGQTLSEAVEASLRDTLAKRSGASGAPSQPPKRRAAKRPRKAAKRRTSGKRG